jgi:SAM-dependent methyltransferase
MATTEPGATAGPPPNAKRKRRWFQYSLRTLLVLVLAFGCGFGWLASKIKRAREQRQAVKAIEELEGHVDYWPASGGMIRTAVAWAGNLLGEDLSVEVRGVYLATTRVTDAGLARLGGLTQLRWLRLASTPVTDAGLAHLRGLTQLQSLQLANTPVTDAGLAHLRGLTQLRWLRLASTQVTDAGVSELKKALPNASVSR